MPTNCFTAFVEETHELNLFPEPEDHDISESESLRPITVRLTPDMVQTLDNLCQKLQVSRQKLLFNMVDGGISYAIDAIANVESRSLAERPPSGSPQEEKDAFYHKVRTDLIKELIA